VKFTAYWLVVRLVLWMCTLPVLLRVRSLPVLLKSFTADANWRSYASVLRLERTVELVERLCRARCFRPPLFPRACLRQSLILYRALTGMGYPAVVHFGVQRDGSSLLRGHSWVTLHGRTLAEPAEPFEFVEVYSYPRSTTPTRDPHQEEVHGSRCTSLRGVVAGSERPLG
jgi:hypothetical protein